MIKSLIHKSCGVCRVLGRGYVLSKFASQPIHKLRSMYSIGCRRALSRQWPSEKGTFPLSPQGWVYGVPLERQCLAALAQTEPITHGI